MIRGALASTRSLSGAMASTKGGTGTPWYRAGGAPLPIAVYEAKGAANLAASYVNVVNPGTFDAAPGVAPTWDVGIGWTFDGSTKYLTTGIVPDNNQQWSALVRFSNITNTGRIFGVGISGGRRWTIQPLTATYQSGGSLLAASAGAGGSGTWAFAADTAYRDGVTEAGTIPATITTFSECLIGAANFATVGVTPSSFGAVNIQYFVIWDVSTNHATWMPAVSAACAAL